MVQRNSERLTMAIEATNTHVAYEAGIGVPYHKKNSI